MIKLIGICALLISAVIIRAELCAVRREHLLLCEEMYRFILHARGRVVCFLSPPSRLCDGFESRALSESGFFEYISLGEDIQSAFLRSGLGNKFNEQEARVIGNLFSKMGAGYLEDEIKHIDACAADFLRLLEFARADTAREIKLISTLTASITVGAVILLI